MRTAEFWAGHSAGPLHPLWQQNPAPGQLPWKSLFRQQHLKCAVGARIPHKDGNPEVKPFSMKFMDKAFRRESLNLATCDSICGFFNCWKSSFPYQKTESWGGRGVLIKTVTEIPIWPKWTVSTKKWIKLVICITYFPLWLTILSPSSNGKKRVRGKKLLSP